MVPIFDLADFFSNFKTGGIPLVFIVINVVQLVKGLSPNRKFTRLISVAFGILIGLAYWLSANPWPVNFAGWLTAVVFGIALGIFAFKSFDAVVDSTAAGQVKALEAVQGSPGTDNVLAGKK